MNIPVTASIAEAIIPFPAPRLDDDFALLAAGPFLLGEIFVVEVEPVDLDAVLDLTPEDDTDPDLPLDFAVPRADLDERDDALPGDTGLEPDDLVPDEAALDELDDLPPVLFLAVEDLLEGEPPDDFAVDARDEPRELFDFEPGALDFDDPDFAELAFVPADLAGPDFEVEDVLVVGIIFPPCTQASI
ncbi:MAG: hypothetical protein ABIO91_03970 [Pyrinomonadaceae bacterium]